MEKTYNVVIPNEIYLDDFSEGLSKDYTVNIPEVLYMYIDEKSGEINDISEISYESDNIIEEVDLSSNLIGEICIILDYVYSKQERVFENITMTNYDGSEYTENINTIPSDYYNIKYNFETKLVETELIIRYEELEPVKDTKMIKSLLEEKILTLDGTDTTDAVTIDSINTFITEVDIYLDITANAKPWNFIVIPDDKPQLPDNLKEILK